MIRAYLRRHGLRPECVPAEVVEALSRAAEAGTALHEAARAAVTHYRASATPAELLRHYHELLVLSDARPVSFTAEEADRARLEALDGDTTAARLLRSNPHRLSR